MNELVLDASITVKWFLKPGTGQAREEGAEQAIELLNAIGERKFRCIQPEHWLAESASVLSRLQPGRARRVTEWLYALELPVDSSLEDYVLASQLAKELNHHLFDTLYHATAINRGATFVTADKQYFLKAHKKGAIRLLGDLSPAA